MRVATHCTCESHKLSRLTGLEPEQFIRCILKQRTGPPFLEIRCKSTAFHTKRSSKNEERAKNLLFVDNLMHFTESDIGTFNRNGDVIVGM